MKPSSREPRVSVVMPVYNGRGHLAETLDSLLAQSLEDWELVVVDDASTDGSWDLLREYAARDPRIRLHRHAENRGHRAASNRTFRLARGRYVARNDQDDPSDPRRLELQAAFLDRHPEVGLLGSAYVRSPEDGRPSVVRPPADHALLRWRLLFNMVFCHSSLVFRRELVCGPNAYRYAPAAYDYEVCARLGRVTRLASLEEPLVRYRLHCSGLSTTANQAMLRSVSAISALQVRRLLRPRPLRREEIESLRRLGTGHDVREPDLARIPLLLELLGRFAEEAGLGADEEDRIRRSWSARLVRHVPLARLGPVLRQDPVGVAQQLVRRAAARTGRLGRRLLGMG